MGTTTNTEYRIYSDTIGKYYNAYYEALSDELEISKDIESLTEDLENATTLSTTITNQKEVAKTAIIGAARAYIDNINALKDELAIMNTGNTREFSDDRINTIITAADNSKIYENKKIPETDSTTGKYTILAVTSLLYTEDEKSKLTDLAKTLSDNVDAADANVIDAMTNYNTLVDIAHEQSSLVDTIQGEINTEKGKLTTAQGIVATTKATFENSIKDIDFSKTDVESQTITEMKDKIVKITAEIKTVSDNIILINATTTKLLGNLNTPKYTITYELNSSSSTVLGTQEYSLGETITALSTTITGYTIDGWVDLPTTMPAQDLTIYASPGSIVN